MFKATIPVENEKYFQAIWKILPGLSLEAEFNVTENGIVIKAMDPAKTALVSIDLPKIFFEELKCNEPLRFLSDVLHVGKLIKPRGLKIELEGDENTLTIRHVAKKYKKTFTSINLKTVDVTYPNLNVERDVSFALKSNWLNEVLEDAVPVSDTFYFKADKEKLTISSEGELSVMEQEIEPGEELQGYSPKTKIERAEYFHEYVRIVVGALYSLVDFIHVKISEGKPLILAAAATSEKPEYKGKIMFRVMAAFGPKP